MRTLRQSLLGTLVLVALGGLGAVGTTAEESQAPDATPVTSDGATVETLTQVTIAANDLPESVDSILLVHLRLPAESSSTMMHNNTAFQLSVPLEGELQMPVTGRTEVIRANGDVEVLDTGVALRARPGDTVIGYDLSLPKTLANPAATPIDLLGSLFAHGGWGVNDVTLVETGSPLEFPGPGGYWLTPYDFRVASLTGRPLLVTIRRVTLEPGARIEVEDRYAAVRLVESGSVTWTLMGSALTFAYDANSPIRYVKPQPGSVIELSNQGSQTAMFYELAIEPASSE